MSPYWSKLHPKVVLHTAPAVGGFTLAACPFTQGMPMKLIGFRFRDLRLLVFGTALLSVAVSCVTEYWGMSRLADVSVAIHHGDAALALVSEDMLDDILQLRRFEKDILINIGSPDSVQSYRAKWDNAFVQLRNDLVRARWAAPTNDDLRLDTVVESISAYQIAFLQTFDQIHSGAVTTTQAANAQADSFKEPAHKVERALVDIGEMARGRAPTLNSALVAQRYALIVNVLLFLLLAMLLVFGTPRDLAQIAILAKPPP
jgi:methyl-accepting chemotaxis protein